MVVVGSFFFNDTATTGIYTLSLHDALPICMPSILTEMGFISNPDEEKFLASEVGQRYLANAIFKAIDSYNSEFKY